MHLSLANDLAERGWLPIVLTVSRNAYRATRDDQLADMDPRIRIYRAFTLDASRDLSIAGRYPRILALPDVWASWVVTGLLMGIWLVLRYKPALIWSTYPIASAHSLAMIVATFSRVRWIADFRDSMTEETYPEDAVQRRVYRWIERRTIARAHRCVFTTPGALKMYSDRYPDRARSFRVVPNGYDERYFSEVDRARREHPVQG